MPRFNKVGNDAKEWKGCVKIKKLRTKERKNEAAIK